MSGFYILSIAGFIVSLLGLYYKCQEVMAAFAGQRQNPSKEKAEESNEATMPVTTVYQPDNLKNNTCIYRMD